MLLLMRLLLHKRSKKAARASQTASELVGDTGIEPVTSSV
jgi:hypothetical protein